MKIHHENSPLPAFPHHKKKKRAARRSASPSRKLRVDAALSHQRLRPPWRGLRTWTAGPRERHVSRMNAAQDEHGWWTNELVFLDG